MLYFTPSMLQIDTAALHYSILLLIPVVCACIKSGIYHVYIDAVSRRAPIVNVI